MKTTTAGLPGMPEILQALTRLMATEPASLKGFQAIIRQGDLQLNLAIGVVASPTPITTAAACFRPPDSGLKALQRRILAVCTREPQNAKKIAGKLSRPCNSYLRGLLTDLCRRNPALLVRVPDGYVRAEAPPAVPMEGRKP